MHIFDKALWHIDAGEDKAAVLAKFQAVFSFLNEKELLSEDGQEIFEFGIDDSVSLNEDMVTKEGAAFLYKHYDEVINCNADSITAELSSRYPS